MPEQVENVLLNVHEEKHEKTPKNAFYCQFWPLDDVEITQKHYYILLYTMHYMIYYYTILIF